MADALFDVDGARFIPSALTRGPWSPDAQHGGPPAALLAHAATTFEDGERMFVARLTVELLRPVPLTPLTLTTAWARPGHKVQLVAASLWAGDLEVARGTALRIRRADIPLPAPTVADVAPPFGPDDGTSSLPPWHEHVAYEAFHTRAVEHRFVRGSFAEPGPATDWIRLRLPVIAGHDTLPLARVAAVADFGNGVSWELSRSQGYMFINPDLTIYLSRTPIGEWICLDAATYPGPEGVGLAESQLRDRDGIIGRALQSLLLDRT